jgi:hypothetical protein
MDGTVEGLMLWTMDGSKLSIALGATDCSEVGINE